VCANAHSVYLPYLPVVLTSGLVFRFDRRPIVLV
jgi:hypothetical protein